MIQTRRERKNTINSLKEQFLEANFLDMDKKEIETFMEELTERIGEKRTFRFLKLVTDQMYAITGEIVMEYLALFTKGYKSKYPSKDVKEILILSIVLTERVFNKEGYDLNKITTKLMALRIISFKDPNHILAAVEENLTNQIKQRELP